MNNSIIIKSFQNGISVFLDPDIPFQELLSEIEEKFQQTEKFFKDAKMALSLSGRILSETEEKQIVTTIIKNSNLNIMCIVGKDEDNNRFFLKALQKIENRSRANESRFFIGNLLEGQTIESETSITIVGDVCFGATVIASENIIVIGGIYGKVFAGDDGNKNHFVYAYEMNPEALQINEFKYQPGKSTIWSKKPKSEPMIAVIEDKKVVFVPVSKDMIKIISENK